MQFSKLVFVMTDKCNAACKICGISCSPNNKHLLDKERIKDYIKQAKELGTFKTIDFTGGEAILFYEQLKECMTYAKSLGFNSTLVSNGFWGADYDDGYVMLSGLVEAGLTDLSISVDQFHQELISIESVKNAVRIADSLGVNTELTFMEVKNGKSAGESMDKLRHEMYYKNFVVYPALPAGRAACFLTEEQILKLYPKNTAFCPIKNTIIVFFDGSITLCCSPFSYEINMVHLGNYRNTPLKVAIQAYNQNDFIYVLLVNKFKWYVDLAEKLGFELEEYFSVPCHLCYQLFTNKDYVNAVGPYVKKEADRIRTNKLLKV